RCTSDFFLSDKTIESLQQGYLITFAFDFLVAALQKYSCFLFYLPFCLINTVYQLPCVLQIMLKRKDCSKQLLGKKRFCIGINKLILAGIDKCIGICIGLFIIIYYIGSKICDPLGLKGLSIILRVFQF